MSEPREPIPVFVPALSAVLVAAEDQKTEPLDEAEVLELRDSAACVMMEEADAAKMVESRGYVDIDPENCWYDWQMLRRELGRKPDLDPGARVDRFNSTDATYQLTIERAQETLVDFRDMIARSEEWLPLIKTEVSNPHSEGRCFIWLNNVKETTDGFVAQVFEIPATLQGFEVGDTIEVLACEVLDWMINADGTLHGGISIRYHRERLPEHERDAFDTHIGVTTYA
ncbi:MAG: DUF2314 domain-containing protein [Planctomycetota bacterium]